MQIHLNGKDSVYTFDDADFPDEEYLKSGEWRTSSVFSRGHETDLFVPDIIELERYGTSRNPALAAAFAFSRLHLNSNPDLVTSLVSDASIHFYSYIKMAGRRFGLSDLASSGQLNYITQDFYDMTGMDKTTFAYTLVCYQLHTKKLTEADTSFISAFLKRYERLPTLNEHIASSKLSFVRWPVQSYDWKAYLIVNYGLKFPKKYHRFLEKHNAMGDYNKFMNHMPKIIDLCMLDGKDFFELMDQIADMPEDTVKKLFSDQ